MFSGDTRRAIQYFQIRENVAVMETKKKGIKTVLRQHKASWINWGTLQCNLHWIYEGRIGAENLCGTFNTTSIAAWLLEKGSVQLTRNQKTLTVSADNWIIILPGTHIQEFSADAEILSMRFDINWPDNRQLRGGPKNLYHRLS